MNVCWASLVAALIAVESPNPSRPVTGDGGAAAGALQIHRAVVMEVNQRDGTAFQWPRDARDPNVAPEICRRYLEHWGRTRGVLSSPEALARIWNGGPNGHQKSSTRDFGQRVGNLYRLYDLSSGPRTASPIPRGTAPARPGAGAPARTWKAGESPNVRRAGDPAPGVRRVP